jgi:hypothetical protein
MFWLLYNAGYAACPNLEIIQHSLIESKQITETSGLVLYQNTFWLHNDSGDSARIFSLEKDTQILTTIPLKDVQARDWEDIAIDRHRELIYIADTGDNRERRNDARIISYSIHSQKTQIIPITYATGSIDTEAIAWDPIQKKLILMSKGRGGTVHVFSLDPHNPPTAPLSSQYQYPISPANGLNPERITAMDISADGNRIAVRNYIELFLWVRTPQASIFETLKTKPCTYDLPPQKQGESLGFDDDGSSLWTLSEGKNQPLLELILLSNEPSPPK